MNYESERGKHMPRNILFAILFVVFPSIIIFLCFKFKTLNKIGAVLLCYFAGIIVGNTGVLPEGFASVQATMQDVSVCLALPLLLFSLDVKSWLKIARKGLLCMALAVVAIIATTFILQLTIGRNHPEGWKLGGLAIGVYTGGTPNLAAIKAALKVHNDTYILFHTYDTVISLIYIFVLCSVARPLFQKVFKLRPFQSSGYTKSSGPSQMGVDTIENYGELLNPSIIKGLFIALMLAASILGVSYIVGGLFPQNYNTAVTILLITTLSIGASFIKPVRSLKNTFQFGMYIIYIFCFTVASMTNLSSLVHIDWTILIYVTVSIFGSLLLHVALCRIANIDSDTTIITSVSAICSPPFVPVVAGALKNKEIIISGLVTGIIGYTIGNYLGIAVAFLYQNIHF